MIIIKTSTITGETNSMDIDVTQEQIDQWEGGMLIQNAMPNLTPDESKFISTGITSEEWSVACADMNEVYYEDR